MTALALAADAATGDIACALVVALFLFVCFCYADERLRRRRKRACDSRMRKHVLRNEVAERRRNGYVD